MWPGRTHQRNWTVAGLNLVGERTDRVGVVQWFESHDPSMAQIGASQQSRTTSRRAVQYRPARTSDSDANSA